MSSLNSFLISTGLALSGVLVAASGAQAQAVPGGAPTREEVQRDRLEQQLRTGGPAVSVQGEVERAPCPLANPEFAALKFTLSRAEFSGLEAIDASLVDAAWQDDVGKELPVAAVCEIRDRAATILRQHGYLAAVQVPAQTIDGGVVRFDVVLARLTQVQVRGDAGPSGRQLQKYIDKLTGQPVFNIDDAERYLLLARDIPGLDVRLTLQPAPRDPGTKPGDVVGVFNVVRTPVYADVNVRNYGSKAVGRFGGLARMRFTGLTGLGDETVVSFFSTADFEEQRVAQASHEFRVGGEGLTLGGSFTYAWTRPDVPGPDAFRSRTMVGSLYASMPFVRSQRANLSGTGGLDIIDQDTDFSGLPLSRDHLRVAFARADFSAIDGDSILGRKGYSAAEPRLGVIGSLELRQGLGVLGASDGCGAGFANCLVPGVVPPSRLDGDPTGFVVRGEGRLEFRPTPLAKFSLRPRFQYSPDALLSFEQFSGGNYTVGRGYDPGAIIGDSGFGIQAEVAYGSLIPETADGLAWQYFAFVDHAEVWTKNIPGDPQGITSFGGGLRGTIARQASLEVVAAVPLERAPFATRKGDARVLVTLTVQLAPWHK
ncbi:MAG: ShlB/FhaC/HecB family hemolysin secretion/activation protein [Sphingomonadales bacterium]|nr:ShlB/FhaC/HecB family hemolysin secretion/activation protein [Sphingomonadales bacterium]MBD3774801.1 ShlB/FhaC/HecB family hemolysin secretion/activation protein [Paracoccaceae bacterium]